MPSDQQRALDQIEKTLADDHPGLGPLFAGFTRLTGREAMPVTERITARPRWRRRRMRSAVVAVVGLAMATGSLLALSLTLPSPPRLRPLLLILVALGLIAFGILSFFEAKWHRTLGGVPV